MVQVSNVVLVTRNARDKVQLAQYVLEQDGNVYSIRRFTGQFGGKITPQPVITIDKGKAKRTVLQQAEQEYASLIKKAMDKGYKKLSELTKTKYEVITENEINEVVPSIKTDQQGNIKPQLAKSSEDCAVSAFNKHRYCSRKLDGVRCLMKEAEPGYIVTISRGGKNYDSATTHLREHPMLKEIFSRYPDIILDGEIYVHGWPLQRISGTARLQTWEERCSHLQYWIYDIVDMKESFRVRAQLLEELADMVEGDPLIKVVEHISLKGWEEIQKYHDRFVSEGFEGLVARNPDKPYSPGKRNSDWIKVKQYKDAEFEITGISEGLRDEDMCFTLKTKTGKEFKAKPIGDRDLKQEYLENWPLLVGKMATVTFFGYSEDGIPTQPVFKSVREKDE